MTFIHRTFLAIFVFIAVLTLDALMFQNALVAGELNIKRERRAIRGCDIPSPCHDDLLAYQNEFDANTKLTTEKRKANQHPSRKGLRPSELRPDLPWLDKLKLPALKFTWDQRIIDYLLFYKNDPKGQSIISSWLRAKDVYKDLIQLEIKNHGLPVELSNLAMIESSYNPKNISRTGASGLWQFMPASGKIYGLKQDQWIDERNDPILSTRSALEFLNDLYERFGNWELSLAAYNAGFGAVLRAVSRYNTNHFWKLLSYENALPWESSNYVAKFLAVSIVENNQKVFGVKKGNTKKPLSFDRAAAPKGVRLNTIAEWCQVDEKTIKRLNPQLLGGRTPPSSQATFIYNPKSSTRRYKIALQNNTSNDSENFRFYAVKHGESIDAISERFGMTTKSLLRLNQLKTSRNLRHGQTLLIPKQQEESFAKAGAQKPAPKRASSTTQDSKTLVAVPEPSFKVSGRKRFFYKVATGDSQSKIANLFGVDRLWMAKWNGLDPEAFLHPNMVLVVWADKRFDPSLGDIHILDPNQVELIKTGSKAHLDRIEEKNGRKRIVYRAKKEISFADIGSKYGLSKWDMARINSKPPTTKLKVGQTAIVYQKIGNKKNDRL